AARPRPPRSRTRRGNVLLFHRAGWRTVKSGVSAWSATACLRKELYYHTAATMAVKDDARTFAGPRRRLILANPKYCSCNQQKRPNTTARSTNVSARAKAE